MYTKYCMSILEYFIRVPTLPWKPGILSFSFLAEKVVNTWNFYSNPGKNLNFANSMFQTSLFKISFDLGFHCFYLKITWKIHGILCHKRSENPASVLTHFEIFITKICMKVPGIWHTQKWEKNWNLGPKTLRKPGFWYLKKKKWEPCLYILRTLN